MLALVRLVRPLPNTGADGRISACKARFTSFLQLAGRPPVGHRRFPVRFQCAQQPAPVRFQHRINRLAPLIALACLFPTYALLDARLRSLQFPPIVLNPLPSIVLNPLPSLGYRRRFFARVSTIYISSSTPRECIKIARVNTLFRGGFFRLYLLLQRGLLSTEINNTQVDQGRDAVTGVRLDTGETVTVVLRPYQGPLKAPRAEVKDFATLEGEISKVIQSVSSDEMRKQVLKGMRAKTEPGGVILVQRAYTAWLRLGTHALQNLLAHLVAGHALNHLCNFTLQRGEILDFSARRFERPLVWPQYDRDGFARVQTHAGDCVAALIVLRIVDFSGKQPPLEKQVQPKKPPLNNVFTLAILIHSRGGDEEMYIVETLAKNRRLYPGEGKGCKTIGGN